MIRFAKSVPIVAVVAATAGFSTVATEESVQAHARCRHIDAHVFTQLTTENCASPVGLCTTGHIDGGPFHSATAFLTLGAAPSAGMPGVEPAANISYSGTLTATQGNGTIILSDLGVLDAQRAAFTELSRTVSGTGRFSNPTGTLVISGALVDNETAFDGSMTGELCTDFGGDDW